LPYGGIDGTWGSRHLFTCEPKHGLLVPITKTVKECDLYQWSKENLGKLAVFSFRKCNFIITSVVFLIIF